MVQYLLNGLVVRQITFLVCDR